MISQTITLRVPDSWAGRLDSATVRSWIAAFLQRPTRDLPADPGGGEARVTLSLPKRAVRVVSGLLDETESAALRRIVAANIGALPAGRPHRALPAVGRIESGGKKVAALPSGPPVGANSKPETSPSNARFAFDFHASAPGVPSGFMPAGMPATLWLDGGEAAAMPHDSTGAFVSAGVPGLGAAYAEILFWLALGVFAFWLLSRLLRGSKALPVAPEIELPKFRSWVPKAT